MPNYLCPNPKENSLLKFNIFNPYTQKIYNSYQFESIELIKKKINLANKGFIKWKNISVTQRVKLIKKALNYFEINKRKIAKDITNETGKPLNQSLNEIAGMFERANYLLSIAEETLKPEILYSNPPFYRKIEHSPLGIIFIISAWNYPLLISINGILPALLSGNVVILKHSKITTSIGTHFEKAFKKIDSYNNLLQQVIITHDTTRKIIETRIVDHVIFTGSEKGGTSIKKSTSKSFIDCNLELGGKDGAYVHDDAQCATAAESLVDGAMYNSGQSCCGIERIYVHKNIYNLFLEKCCEIVGNYKLGNPMEPSTTMGPIATPHSIKLMEHQIKEALKKGAKIVYGGKKLKINNALFFEPTIITGVKNTMGIMQDENFGPLLPIMKVSNIDQAINLINDSKYGLTASIFTTDKKQADYFGDNVIAGTIFMNRCDYLDPALPWTGAKLSGKGSSLSKYGFYALTTLKSFNFKLK